MKNKKLLVGIMFLGVWSMGLTGFGKVVDSAVVEEKTTGDESRAWDSAENADRKDNGEMLTVSEQVQAPETYQGVPVEVPDVEAITIKSVVPQVYTDEEVQGWLDLFAEIGDERTLETDEPKVNKEDERYAISGNLDIGQKSYEFYVTPGYVKGADGEARKDKLTGFYGVSLYLSLDFSAIDTDTNAASAFENIKNMGKAQEKAEEILQKFGIGDFSLCGEKVQERGLYDQEGQRIAAEYGVGDFVYERMIDGIPLTWVGGYYLPFYAGENDGTRKHFDDYRWDSEALMLQCTDDRLWNFTYINPLKISDYSDEKQFLLPFEEIRKIYEFTITEKFKLTDEVKLSKVRLGYMRIRETDEREGLLVPVWDFFGTTKTQTEEYYSLLTIDARDGMIRYRKWGY